MSVEQNIPSKATDLQEGPAIPTSFNSVVIRAQKKLLSRLSNKTVVKHILDQRLSQCIELLHQILLFHYSSIVAAKIIKYVLKVTMKIGLLVKENVLTERHQNILNDVEVQLGGLAMTISSFQTISYSYEYSFLAKSLHNLHSSIHSIVSELLSEKSVERLGFIFEHLTQKEFLDTAFSRKDTSLLSLASVIECLLYSSNE